jgi:hypothetical protein
VILVWQGKFVAMETLSSIASREVQRKYLAEPISDECLLKVRLVRVGYRTRKLAALMAVLLDGGDAEGAANQ